MEFANKTVIITGGTSGIGYASARLFADEGANVVISGSRKDGSNILKEINHPDTTCYFSSNVSKEEEVEALVQYTIDTFGGIDIAVACAGIPGQGDVISMDKDTWHKILSVDLDGVFYLNKHVLAYMSENNIKGSIVNVSSIGGLVGFPHDITYCSAKGAVINFTRSAAVRVAKQGIRVNGVAPGYVMTPLLENLPEDVLKEMIDLHPMKRIGKPEEIAKAIAFLSSDNASFITGITLAVDGGYTAI